MPQINNNVRNPRTGLYDYAIHNFSPEKIRHYCNNFRNHNKQWCNLTIDDRIQALQDWKLAVENNKQALVDALMIDTGRKWETLLEVDLVASSIDRWCSIAKQFFAESDIKNTAIPFIKLQQHLVPYELVGVISPWNFPLLLSLIDTIPALLSGCSVLVKPSELTPRFIEIIENTINSVPALNNVCSFIAGDGAIGAALVDECDLICFTGSTITGKKVYDAASKKMIPVFLELGGKDPAIVLDGANIDLSSSSILWGSTANAGQSCLSIERVYVQENIYDSFVQQIVAKASALQLNAVDINVGEIGPIIFEKQVAIINEHLKDALVKGATINYGSAECENIDGGFYCKPTILTNVNHTMKIMQEETFGPIIPIMKFATKAEAITLANGTVYGLSGAVFAATNAEAMELANDIVGGAISINDCALTAIMHEGEKNSFKLSGIGGTRMGANAIKRFMRQKVFIIKNEDMKSPWWYKA
jgi:succinate-semialdehyde dehydrogenase / glutarate-semialdehyde dehydrogenase